MYNTNSKIEAIAVDVEDTGIIGVIKQVAVQTNSTLLPETTVILEDLHKILNYTLSTLLKLNQTALIQDVSTAENFIEDSIGKVQRALDILGSPDSNS